MTLLTKRMVEKPWGKDVLPAPFVAPDGKRIGEVWFEPPAEIPSILVKYIFTSEKLSVQVHPNDEQAAALGETGRGKEECWLVIDAEPDATLGIGFKQPIAAEAMRHAALVGNIEELMEWYPVKRGDFFYIPAGTVHAIGAGVSLIEIQQNSDITYRLFDYGRPRKLNLDEAIKVANGVRLDPGLVRNLSSTGTSTLANGPHFKLHRICGAPDEVLELENPGPCLALPTQGKIVVERTEAVFGECVLAPSLKSIEFDPSGACLVVFPI